MASPSKPPSRTMTFLSTFVASVLPDSWLKLALSTFLMIMAKFWRPIFYPLTIERGKLLTTGKDLPNMLSGC